MVIFDRITGREDRRVFEAGDRRDHRLLDIDRQ
jgi:hypothetical protein